MAKIRYYQYSLGRDLKNNRLFSHRDGYFIWVEPGTDSATLRRLGSSDMFSHPHISFAAADFEETQAFEHFVNELLTLKLQASPDLRWYILQLVYDDQYRRNFLEHPDDELEAAPLSDEEKDALRQVVDKLQAEVETFKPGKIVDDGDHFLLFPQTVERIAPRAWFDAAWPFVAHFRSNFGLYLGEALLYSRVTIVGSSTVNPAVTGQQENFLNREAEKVGRLVERISITNANDLGRILDWGVAHDVRFGLGGEVTAMILASDPDDEIQSRVWDKVGERAA